MVSRMRSMQSISTLNFGSCTPTVVRAGKLSGKNSHTFIAGISARSLRKIRPHHISKRASGSFENGMDIRDAVPHFVLDVAVLDLIRLEIQWRPFARSRIPLVYPADSSNPSDSRCYLRCNQNRSERRLDCPQIRCLLTQARPNSVSIDP